MRISLENPTYQKKKQRRRRCDDDDASSNSARVDLSQGS